MLNIIDNLCNENIIKELNEGSFSNGYYIKVSDLNKDLNNQEYVIIHNKKKDDIVEQIELINWLKTRDIYSNYLTNKFLVSKGNTQKIITSCNMNSFFFNAKKVIENLNKKNFKFTNMKDYCFAIINDYFEALKNKGGLYNKYNTLVKTIKIDNLKGKKLKEKREEILLKTFKKQFNLFKSDIRAKKINKYKLYLLKNKEQLINIIKNNPDLKIKLFFDDTIENYKKEYELYIVPNIFTDNKYNKFYNNEIYGLPPTLGFNAKKPLLPSTSRKITTPSLFNMEDSLKLNNFLLWLEKQPNKYYKNEDYYEYENKDYYIRFDKGKEVRIKGIIKKTKHKITHSKLFYHTNVLSLKNYLYEPTTLKYGDKSLIYYIDKMFYGGKLENNLFKKLEISSLKKTVNTKLRNVLITNNKNMQSYLTNHNSNQFSTHMCRIFYIMFKEQYKLKDMKISNIRRKFNFLIELLQYFKKEDVKNMNQQKLKDLQNKLLVKVKQGNPICDNDEEFYYYIGQVAYYLSSLSKSQDKTVKILDNIINYKNIIQLKNKLIINRRKYNYEILLYNKSKFFKLFTMIMDYQPKSNKVKFENNIYIELGALSTNLIYLNENENKKGGNKNGNEK